MKALLRRLLALLLGLSLILSAPAGGGGGGGGIGVLILPNVWIVLTNLGSVFELPLSEARMHRQFEDVSGGLEMRMPLDMTQCVGTFFVPVTRTLGGLRVVDGSAVISGAQFDSWFRAGIDRIEVVFSDGEGRCLPLVLMLDSSHRSVDVYVF